MRAPCAVVGFSVALAVIVVAIASCREPTSILIEASTNVPYRAGIVTSFTVGKPGLTESAEATTESHVAWSTSGIIGSLVVVPETTDEASVSIKLVMGVRRDPRECNSATNAEGCIFARRRLRYTPHEQLRLPITLYSRCEGVPCDANTTCNYLGTCVSSEVDPSTCETASGCSPKDDPPRISDGVVIDGGDGEREAGRDPDASFDGGAIDASDASDGAGGKKDGGGGLSGQIDCRSTTCTPGQICCYNPLTTVGSCIIAPASCPGSNVVTITCDGTEDCATGSCCAVSSSSISCQDTNFCFNNGAILCHSDNTCAFTTPPSACTGQVHNYFNSCIH